MTEETKLWKQMDQYIDLYKFYWDLSLKVCTYFIGIAGAISAYTLKNQDVEFMSFALILPIGLSIFGLYLAHTSLPGLKLVRDEVEKIGNHLNLNTYPEFRSLITFISALRLIFGSCVIGLIYLFITIYCK
ncbi:hypothetical protein [Shewanella japonica]|uniref:hypothetical protein n=1 Tax=Shewanella japonica TaxID=93973 RepID=UPI0024954BB2|nr:hypothetical protein [Shewanella japonica]